MRQSPLKIGRSPDVADHRRGAPWVHVHRRCLPPDRPRSPGLIRTTSTAPTCVPPTAATNVVSVSSPRAAVVAAGCCSVRGVTVPAFDTLARVFHGRAGATPTMVGRTAALARLVDVFDTLGLVDVDQPAVVLVSGQAGIGKTRLLREFVEATAPESPASPAIVIAGEPGSVGRAAGALGVFADSPDPTRALIDAVAVTVATTIALVVVEDIHWLDAESAGAVDLLTQQPWPRLMVVGTYRPDELTRGAPGGELVQRLERRHNVEQIRLEPLERKDVAAMVAAIIQRQPSSADVAAVDRRSGGVPFVIEELVRCGRSGSGSEQVHDTFADDVLSAELPWSLDEAVRQQISGLTTDEILTLEVLAVYGRAIGFDTLCAVAQFTEPRALAALRSLIDRGVAVEVTDDRFWFVHALVADAVSGQLIGRERRRLHQRCFDAERSNESADFSTLARHASGAGRFDQIVDIARTGAPQYLARGASFQALRLAADGLSEAPDDPLLLGIATEAAWRLDFNDEAIGTARRWCQFANEPADRIEAERMLGRLAHESGDAEGRRASIVRLKRLFADAVDVSHRAVAAAAVAQLLMLSSSSAEAVEWGDRAIADGRAFGDEHAVARGLVERGSALLGLVSRHESVAVLTEAIEAARRVNDPVLESRALNNVLEAVPVYSPVGRRHLQSLVEITRRSGFEKLGVGPAHFWHLHATIGDGDLAALRRMVGNRYSDVDESTLWWSHRYRATEAFLWFEEGRIDDAARWRGELTGAESCDIEPVLGLTMSLAAHQGLGSARATFDAIVALEPTGDRVTLFTDAVLVVEAALAVGIPAAEIRHRFVNGWLGTHQSHAELAATTEGLLALAEGRNDDAVALLADVLDHPDDRLIRPLIGTLRTALAQALLALGDRAGSLAAATQAVEHDLAALAGRSARPVRGAASAVTRFVGPRRWRSDRPRNEVASLLADGLTNGQLAERLFISPKTAAVHVSNILTKLGLASRAEIAAWFVRNSIHAVA